MTDPMTPAALAEIAARKPTPIKRTDGVHVGPLVPSLAVELRALTFEEVQRHVADHERLLAEVERLAAENARLRDAERIAWDKCADIINAIATDARPATNILFNVAQGITVTESHRASMKEAQLRLDCVLDSAKKAVAEARAAIDAAKETP